MSACGPVSYTLRRAINSSTGPAKVAIAEASGRGHRLVHDSRSRPPVGRRAPQVFDEFNNCPLAGEAACIEGEAANDDQVTVALRTSTWSQ